MLDGLREQLFQDEDEDVTRRKPKMYHHYDMDLMSFGLNSCQETSFPVLQCQSGVRLSYILHMDNDIEQRR